MKNKIMKIGSDFEVKSGEIKKKEKRNKGENVVVNYLSLGWYLVSPILLGLVIGLYLDRLFKTKPIFVLVLTLLGAVGTFYNLIKISRTN